MPGEGCSQSGDDEAVAATVGGRRSHYEGVSKARRRYIQACADFLPSVQQLQRCSLQFLGLW